MKLAPFGKPLKALQDKKLPPHNDIYLYIGKDSWEQGKNSSMMRPTRTLILPPTSSPFYYSWPISLCDVLIIDTDETNEDLIQDIVSILFNFGAVIIRYVDINDHLTVFKRN